VIQPIDPVDQGDGPGAGSGSSGSNNSPGEVGGENGNGGNVVGGNPNVGTNTNPDPTNPNTDNGGTKDTNNNNDDNNGNTGTKTNGNFASGFSLSTLIGIVAFLGFAALAVGGIAMTVSRRLREARGEEEGLADSNSGVSSSSGGRPNGGNDGGRSGSIPNAVRGEGSDGGSASGGIEGSSGIPGMRKRLDRSGNQKQHQLYSRADHLRLMYQRLRRNPFSTPSNNSNLQRRTSIASSTASNTSAAAAARYLLPPLAPSPLPILPLHHNRQFNSQPYQNSTGDPTSPTYNNSSSGLSGAKNHWEAHQDLYQPSDKDIDNFQEYVLPIHPSHGKSSKSKLGTGGIGKSMKVEYGDWDYNAGTYLGDAVSGNRGFYYYDGKFIEDDFLNYSSTDTKTISSFGWMSGDGRNGKDGSKSSSSTTSSSMTGDAHDDSSDSSSSVKRSSASMSSDATSLWYFDDSDPRIRKLLETMASAQQYDQYHSNHQVVGSSSTGAKGKRREGKGRSDSFEWSENGDFEVDYNVDFGLPPPLEPLESAHDYPQRNQRQYQPHVQRNQVSNRAMKPFNTAEGAGISSSSTLSFEGSLRRASLSSTQRHQRKLSDGDTGTLINHHINQNNSHNPSRPIHTSAETWIHPTQLPPTVPQSSTLPPASFRSPVSTVVNSSLPSPAHSTSGFSFHSNASGSGSSSSKKVATSNNTNTTTIPTAIRPMGSLGSLGSVGSSSGGSGTWRNPSITTVTSTTATQRKEQQPLKQQENVQDAPPKSSTRSTYQKELSGASENEGMDISDQPFDAYPTMGSGGSDDPEAYLRSVSDFNWDFGSENENEFGYDDEMNTHNEDDDDLDSTDENENKRSATFQYESNVAPVSVTTATTTTSSAAAAAAASLYPSPPRLQSDLQDAPPTWMSSDRHLHLVSQSSHASAPSKRPTHTRNRSSFVNFSVPAFQQAAQTEKRFNAATPDSRASNRSSGSSFTRMMGDVDLNGHGRMREPMESGFM
jgi:hypothetical protein